MLENLTLEDIDNMTVVECQAVLDEWPKTPSGLYKGVKVDKLAAAKLFALRCTVKHGGTYRYTDVVYTTARQNVTILCPEHGVFSQVAHSHTIGQGCPTCTNNILLTLQQFKDKARTVHGNLYDYSKTNYINNHTKIDIICAEHGVFTQKPNNHLSGKGCTRCAGNAILGTEEFINKARKVHGDRYIYTDTQYIRSAIKVAITCPEHGRFLQNPNSHLNYNGCPRCTTNIDTVYLWQVEGTSTYKIGVVKESRLNVRVSQVANRQKVTPILLTTVTIGHHEARDYEQKTHKRLREEGYQSKLITSGDGYTEFFDLPDDVVVDLIEEIMNAGK